MTSAPRGFVLGVSAVAGIFSLAGVAVADDTSCPVHEEHYAAEKTVFGWPLTPSGWSWNSPDCWNKSSGGYVTCGGLRQSPMDIDITQRWSQGEGSVGSLFRASKYLPVNGAVRHSKTQRAVVVAGNFGTLSLKDSKGADVIYDAVELHVTAGSLHTINGEFRDAEVMLYHTPRVRTRGVEGVIVSALVRSNDLKNSSLLSQLGFPIDGIVPEASGAEARWGAPGTNGDGIVNILGCMKAPLEGHAWSYDGSVPVPPCHETVKWFVLEEEIEAHSNQVLALRRMLSADMALLPLKNKRSPVKRNRAITKDTLVVGSDHRGVSCKAFSAAQRARSAACWTLLEQGCGEDGFQFTPVAISRSTSLTSGEPKKPSDLASYRAAAAESIIVQPSMYTLDILPKKKDTDVLGHMMIHGRLFPVSKVSVKAVAQHVIEGKQFEAELVIEHTMFGDFIKDTVKHPAYQPKEHLVMLSVPITLGPQSDLLRQIGLGARVFDQTIRDGQAYSPIEAVDLQEGLSTVLNGEMFWYNGGKSLPGCTESVRWLVLETPITASLAQLNQLSRPVPGVDSTVLPVDSPITAKWKTYAGHIPPHAVQVDEECPAEHIGWSYLNTHCWDKCEVGCSQTCMIGQSQSPINVDTSAVTQERNDNFLHICRWKPVAQLHVANSGHSFVVANQQMGYIQQTGAGGYPDFYQVAQILVHMPSEHMLDGRIFHGELHVVHAKQISDEELDWTSLLVTAIFLEVGDLENGLLNQLLFPVKSKPEPPQVHQYEVSDYPIDLLRALGPVIDGPFYTYNGSLTTPPCSEYVKWFVFETPQSMSLGQWVYFKKNFANPANNRPAQALNGRRLAKNSFDLPGVTKELEEFDTWQLRQPISGKDGGRDWRDPSPAWIIMPIFFTVVLCIVAMAATFVREDLRRREEGSGGLEERIGKAAYASVPN